MFAINHENPVLQQILEMTKKLSLQEQCSIVAFLNREIDENKPQEFTGDDAIALYLADRCSLAYAAELATMDRWEFIEALKQKKIPVHIQAELSAAEIDHLADQLEQKGVLCSS